MTAALGALAVPFVVFTAFKGRKEPDGRAASGSGGSPQAAAPRVPAAKIWNTKTAPHVTELNGHADTVYLVTFDPDGTAKLWNTKTGALITHLDKHRAPAYWAAFSPDGTALATAGDDKTVRIWDAATGTPITSLTGHKDAIGSVVFGPDGGTLAGAGNDHTAKIWQGGREISRRVRGRPSRRRSPRTGQGCWGRCSAFGRGSAPGGRRGRPVRWW